MYVGLYILPVTTLGIVFGRRNNRMGWGICCYIYGVQWLSFIHILYAVAITYSYFTGPEWGQIWPFLTCCLVRTSLKGLSCCIKAVRDPKEFVTQALNQKGKYFSPKKCCLFNFSNYRWTQTWEIEVCFSSWFMETHKPWTLTDFPIYQSGSFSEVHDVVEQPPCGAMISNLQESPADFTTCPPSFMRIGFMGSKYSSPREVPPGKCSLGTPQP